MTPSAEFIRELDQTFQGRFRVRYSLKHREWHLEQKVQHGQVIPPPLDPFTEQVDTYDDAWIRARDGYVLTMILRDGDRMPCPICGFEVKVPIMETRESHCDYCKSQGRDGRYMAAFYPMNHVLIEHLRYIDPLTDGVSRVRQRVRDRQLREEATKAQRAIDEGQEKFLDNKFQAMNVPMVGYGPKTAQRTDDTFHRLRGME